MKVVIGASSFAAEDKSPLKLLESAGVEAVLNPLGRRWNQEETIRFLAGADGILAGLEPLNRQVLESARSTLKAGTTLRIPRER